MKDQPTPSWRAAADDLLPYIRRLIVTIVIVALALLVWALKDVFILAFAAILIAIALLTVAAGIRRVTRVGPKVGLALAVALVVLVLIGIGWFTGPQIATQVPALFDRLAETLADLETQYGISISEGAWTGVLGFAQGLLSGVAALVLVLVAAILIASSPASYREGLILLVPHGWHDKLRLGLDKAGDGLGRWLTAQLVAMPLVGLMIGLGAWALDLPSPFALGLIAGLGEFVPILGPLIAAAPAILIAISEGGSNILSTVILYVIVAQIEANIIMPTLQRRIIHVPPVLLMFSFLALGLLFGIPGIIVAAPLSISIFILVREFYVADLLGGRAELEAEPATAAPPTATMDRSTPKPRRARTGRDKPS